MTLSVPHASSPEIVENRRITFYLAAILGAGVLARVACVFYFFDLDWEHDGYNHVLFAKSVYAQLPESLWYANSVWAKPLYTIFFASLYQIVPTAWPALVVTQATNALLWTAAAWLTLLVAKDIFRHRQTLLLLAVLCAFTFVAFRASVTANTEPSGALTFALGLFFWHRRRMMAASLFFGLVILARTDAVFCVVVFALAAIIEPALDRRPNWLGIALLRGAVFALPTLLWDVVGFLQTGSPLFLLTHGYPSERGVVGFGHVWDYVVSFLVFDTVLFVAFFAGAALVLMRPRQASPLLLVSTIMGLVYFIAMTAIWTFGAFGSAGYVRYFVFAYPIYILVAGVALDRLFSYTANRGLRPTVMAASLSLVVLLQLHWFAHDIVWINHDNTQPPQSAVWRLPTLPIDWGAKAVYTDHPDAAYYLGHDRFYMDRHPLAEITNPNARGFFIFVTEWSEIYSPGLSLSAFEGVRMRGKLEGPYGEGVYVFER